MWPITRISLALTAGLLLLAGAGCGPSIPKGSMLIPKTEVRALERRAAAVQRCRGALAQAGTAHRRTQLALEASRRRVALLERRLGVGAFTPKELLRGEADWRLALPSVRYVAGQGAKAQRARLGKLLAGHRAVVLGYWATWCKPCTSPEELAQLDELAKALQPYNVALHSLAVDSLDKVLADPRAATWRYPLLQRDDGHLDTLPQALVQRAGLGLPLFVVVDATGRVHWVRKGRLSPEVVSELVTAAARVGR